MTELVFIDAKWDGKIELTEKLKEYLKKHKTKSLVLFASTQFTDLDEFINQLEILEIKVNTTKAKRTSDKIQILGCDCYSNSFENSIIEESDLILYIGDGLFHPKALLLAQAKTQRIKPVTTFNPMSNSIEELDKDSIENQITRMKRNLKMYVNSTTIGILVTIKPGQQYFNSAKKLKEQLEKEGKKAYIFIGNSLDLNDLENYTFIQSWVNTACPRIGTDDIVNTDKPIINLHEAFNPTNALEEFG